MRNRLRPRVPLAALAAAGLVTVALPLSVSSTISAKVGVPMYTAASAAQSAAQSAANSALSCSAPTIYNVNSAGNFYALNYTATPPTDSPGTPSSLGGGSSSVNALAIAADGLTAFTANQTPLGSNTTVHVENIAAGTDADFTAPATNVSTVNSGGVNPTNGYYYYGGWNSTGSTFYLFAFNPTTDTASEAGTITPPTGFTYESGDLTFDNAGNMTDLAGSTADTAKLLSVAAPVPTSGTGALPFRTLATTPTSSGSYVGIAFAADSSLYVETTTGALYSVNPNSGAITSLGIQTGYSGSLTDLASCSYNGSLAVQKNIVGRVASTDQFTMTITGGDVSSGNTGTTSGSSTGVQTSPGSVAGPIVGLAGTTYNVVETAASGSLSNYSTTWACLNGSNPFSSGSGTSFSVLFPNPTGSAGASILCTFTNTPASITVTKTPSPTAVTAAGQTITYSYAVTNSGPVPLTSVTVADIQAPPAGSLASGPTCNNLTNPMGMCSGSTVATLAPGQIAQFAATYVVSQADMDQGSVADSATATASAPSGTGVSATTNASVVATWSPSVSITKSADPTTYSGAGTPITYSYAVENTGNVTLSAATVTDPMAGLSTIDCGNSSNVIASLAPGATVTCTASYSTTQADVDAGSIFNTGTVQAAPPSGPAVSDSDSVTVTSTQSPQITLTKSADPTTYSGAGTQITYSYAVENTGNVTLSAATVTDPMAGLSTIDCGNSSNVIASLAPGATVTCTASYSTTQADVDAGSIFNTGTVQAAPPSGPAVSDSDSVTVTSTQSPQITLTKSADPTTYSGAGTPITYSYAVENTGNVTLSAATVTDPMAGLSTIDCGNSSNVIASLAPGATVTCTASYSTTQADVDAGSIFNTGTVQAAPPSGPAVSDSDSVTVTFVAPSCYTGAWPSAAQGYHLPRGGQPPGGFFLGVEGDSWHLLTHNPSGQKVYSGTITTTGTFTGLQAVRLESVDHFALVNPQTITFRFVTNHHDDEISFTTQCGNQVEFSPLKINGHAARTSSVFLGSGITNPTSTPVTFTRNS